MLEKRGSRTRRGFKLAWLSDNSKGLIDAAVADLAACINTSKGAEAQLRRKPSHPTVVAWLAWTSDTQWLSLGPSCD